ncbi:MAG: hypothetical protein HKN40_01265 [Winogradskyella sp.]|uniref:hypothetical protein n=1 Tax=Winogradskyella sp. TaxID=1883156 RepID=UPI00182F778A|nr:hypothetical protein [Winogradskyella sp.]
MELVLNQELEYVPEPIEVLRFKNRGLLNSNYKSLVKQNFSRSKSKSIFGIRQRLKSTQFNTINHTAVILKISVFAILFVALF